MGKGQANARSSAAQKDLPKYQAVRGDPYRTRIAGSSCFGYITCSFSSGWVLNSGTCFSLRGPEPDIDGTVTAVDELKQASVGLGLGAQALPGLEPRQLTWRIKNASSWLQLLETCALYLPQFNALHYSALITHIAQIHRPSDLQDPHFQVFLTQTITNVSNASNHFDARGLANLIWALCKLGYKPNNAWFTKFANISNAKLLDCGPQELANTIWALAKLSYCPKDAWMGAFWEASMLRLPTFSPQAQSMVLWSAASLGVRPPKPWLAKFWDLTVSSLDQYSQQGLANVAFAAARLQLSPPPAWQAALLAAVAAHISIRSNGGDQATTQSIATLMLSLAKMGIRPPATLARSMLSSFRRHVGDVTPHQLTLMVWSVARLNLQPPADWLNLVASAALARRTDCSGRTRAVMLWALVHTGHRLSEEWLGGWLGASLAAMPSHSSLDLVIMLVTLARLRRGGEHQEWVEAALARMRELGFPMQPSQLSWMAWALARLRAVVPATLLRELLQALQIRFHAFQGLDLALCGWAVAKLGVSPPSAWLASYLAAVRARQARLSDSNLSLVLWALACLDPRGCGRLLSYLQRDLGLLARLSPATLASLLRSAGRAGHVLPEEAAAALDARLADAAPAMDGMAASLALQACGQLGRTLRRGQGVLAASARLSSLAFGGSLQPADVKRCACALAQRRGSYDYNLPAGLAAALVGLLPRFAPAPLVLTLWALARARVRLTPGQWKAVQARVAVLLPVLGGDDWARLLWSMVRGHAKPPPPLLEELQAALELSMPQLEARHVAVCMWALGALRCRSKLGWLARGLQVLDQGVDDLTGGQLASALRGLSHLAPDLTYSAPPLAAFMLPRLMAACQQRMGDMSPRALVDVLCALASLSCTPREAWVRMWLGASRRKLPEFRANHLSAALAALRRLGVSPDPGWERDFMRLLEVPCASIAPHQLPVLVREVHRYDRGLGEQLKESLRVRYRPLPATVQLGIAVQ